LGILADNRTVIWGKSVTSDPEKKNENQPKPQNPMRLNKP